MKVPNGLLDPQGKLAKGNFYLEANGEEVKEFGLTVTGNHSTCYALVSSGDVLTANFSVNSGTTEEFADLVVDGILRNSWRNSRGANNFTYIFERVLYRGSLIGETKKAKSNKFVRMKVLERDTSRDILIDGKQDFSAVGSIQIQIYRREAVNDPKTEDQKKEPSVDELKEHGSGSGIEHDNRGMQEGIEDAGGPDTSPEQTNATAAKADVDIIQRGPAYDKFATWQDLNVSINSELLPPPFEIGFFEQGKFWPNVKERVLKKYSGDYVLWASFTFLLRSTADLQALGFANVHLRYSPITHSSSFSTTTKPFLPCSQSAGAQTGDSEDALLVNDKEDNNHQITVDPKKELTNTDSDTIKDENATSTSTFEQKVQKDEQDKLHPNVKVSSTADTESIPKSHLANKEAPEQPIVRKTTELVLPGLKSAPAQQAWEQRGATQEPEEETTDVESMFHSVGLQMISLISESEMDVDSETEVNFTQAAQLQTSRDSRQASLAVSEDATEAVSVASAEIASPEIPEVSRLSSQKVYNTSPDDISHSQASQIAVLQSNQASFCSTKAPFNHTVQSPILGSFCRFKVVNERDLSPTTTQASPVMSLLTQTPVRSTEQYLPSPPPSTHKRKADSMIGYDTVPQVTLPNHDLNQQKAALIGEEAKVGQHIKETGAHNEELRQSIEAARANARSTIQQASQQPRKNSEPRLVEEVKRQTEFARARMEAAEQQRKELQAKYEVAVVLQKEREKINQMNKEAENLERENAELTAKIAALYPEDI